MFGDFKLILNVGLIFGEVMNNLIVWLFFLATLINLARNTSPKKLYDKDSLFPRELLNLSGVMFLSYLLSLPLYDFSGLKFYGFFISQQLVYLVYDLLTIFVVCNVLNVLSNKAKVVRFYLVLGMTINGILFFVVHICIINAEKGTPFLPLWMVDFYFYTINISDAVMVISLVLCRDFLLLYKLKNMFIKRSSMLCSS